MGGLRWTSHRVDRLHLPPPRREGIADTPYVTQLTADVGDSGVKPAGAVTETVLRG